MGEADSGVAGGALDDRASRLDEAALFGVLDDVEGSAVLDASSWFHELGLAEHLAAGLGADLVETDERRVADGTDKAVDGAHVCGGDGRQRRGRSGRAARAVQRTDGSAGEARE